MSDEKPAQTTRRTFLGTATVATAATAATLTSPIREASAASTKKAGESIKLAQANAEANEKLTEAAKASDWTKPAAMAIPNQAGCGGTAPSRSRNPKAETVKVITGRFPHWFTPAFAKFGDAVDKFRPLFQNLSGEFETMLLATERDRFGTRVGFRGWKDRDSACRQNPAAANGYPRVAS